MLYIFCASHIATEKHRSYLVKVVELLTWMLRSWYEAYHIICLLFVLRYLPNIIYLHCIPTRSKFSYIHLETLLPTYVYIKKKCHFNNKFC